MASDEQRPAEQPGVSGRRTKNRNWIWLYAVLFVLAAVAITINLLFNLRQQLTFEQLQAARALWQNNGPADYELTFTKDLGGGGGEPGQREVIHATIRRRRVVAATLNGTPMPERLWSDYDMPAWFDYLSENLERDRQPDSPRVFCRAKFDSVDGHIIHYVRSSRAEGRRVEVRIEMSK